MRSILELIWMVASLVLAAILAANFAVYLDQHRIVPTSFGKGNFLMLVFGIGIAMAFVFTRSGFWIIGKLSRNRAA